MRIAYVSDSLLPPRAANAIQTMQTAAALQSLGHDVRLFAPSHEDRARGRAARQDTSEEFGLEEPVPLSYLPLVDVRGRLRGSYHVSGVLAAKAWRAELLYTRAARIGLLATRCGLDTVVETHLVPNSERAWRVARALAGRRRLVRWAFISDRLRARVAEGLGDALPDDRVVVAHDAVDGDRFNPAMARDAAREQIGVSCERPLIVHSGQLYEGRGAELLVTAAAALEQADILLVGGHATDVRRVQDMVARAGVKNLQVLGHRSYRDVPAFLFAADILVMPYTSHAVASDRRSETIDYASPLKLFEYMAAGRAIVATRFPGIAEVLRDRHNALLVEPDRAEPLVAALGALLSDRALAERLGAQARSDVTPWTWAARATMILGGGPPPAFAP